MGVWYSCVEVWIVSYKVEWFPLKFVRTELGPRIRASLQMGPSVCEAHTKYHKSVIGGGRQRNRQICDLFYLVTVRLLEVNLIL